MSNNNRISNPRPHDNAITKTELICRYKEETYRRHTAGTQYAITKMKLIYHHKDETHRRYIVGTQYAITKTKLIAVTKTELNNHHKDGC